MMFTSVPYDYVVGGTIATRISIPELHGGDVGNAKMKIDVGGVERLAASTYVARRRFADFSYTVAAGLDTDGISILAQHQRHLGRHQQRPHQPRPRSADRPAREPSLRHPGVHLGHQPRRPHQGQPRRHLSDSNAAERRRLPKRHPRGEPRAGDGNLRRFWCMRP